MRQYYSFRIFAMTFLSIIIVEIIFRIFVNINHVDTLRLELMGKAVAEQEMRLSTIPYLTYIPTPNFKINGTVEHNKDGYRGELISLEKNENEFRILFLGGSTTYGAGVNSYKETYPHNVIKLLNQDNNIQYSYINGGIPYGTSAELLTHYLFKYKYYSPDMVIINTGGNDADAYNIDNYQPDYNNWRMLPGYIPKPNNLIKLALKSKVFSYLYVALTMPELYRKGRLYHFNTETRTSWFNENKFSKYDYKFNAFHNNINELVRSITENGSNVVMLSFRGNIELPEEQELEPYYKYHDTIMIKITKKYNCMYLDFPVSRIPNNLFIDDCHLNKKGEELKAKYVTEYIAPIIDSVLKLRTTKL